ncbi:hypothetical protein A2875_03690 [Candidatus Gottesmanbacteria bacterium RIFCSPHIGHO2_01_FULL_46_14]|uniref:Uncharacterized protein n=3 Tax=Candidatus Gottesmaniibacteriota TaxID=1752720 RepID=A0A1F5ZNC0_9BACT|nr:MAG: hypothetical protein UY08_C0006G0019 [Candidatus Gottesmanbacteria bacterium GW2011_GWA1_47_8]OGG13845.1 MAG: hypothetical protein A2875_03690 [Candidatus Gottesmanbacteria bacterium RIFCSPHIGHO2_01_FULL_46_14]OGG29605.1 MAG: hypothetical protein A2971_01015 [Candidatus Gottesmanbacteria bacterium RIFCSPLOWO2_01_FULL_46_21]
MNKDALLATLIGFGIGLVITGTFLFGPNIVKGLPSISIKLPRFSFGKTPPGVSPTPSPQSRITGLTVTSPLAEALAEKKELLVSGTAPSGTAIVIAGPQDEDVVSANQNNTFGGQITLIEGKNDILVTAFINQKEDQSNITVYFTPGDL